MSLAGQLTPLADLTGSPVLLLASAGLGMALLLRGGSGRLGRAGLALGLAVGSGALFFGVLSIDRFAIFTDGYLITACLLAPASFLLAVVRRWGRRHALGAGLWALGVGGLHGWLIAIASASV